MSHQENRDALLHILRNPHGWSEETVRDARQLAANELERLWATEQTIKFLSKQLAAICTERGAVK